MKKFLIITAVLVLAVSFAFAKFDKSNFSFNNAIFAKTGQVGVSYTFNDKFEVGLEVCPQICPAELVLNVLKTGSLGISPEFLIIPFGGHVTADVRLLNTGKTSVWGGAGFVVALVVLPDTSTMIGYMPNVHSKVLYSLNEHNSLYARILLPLSKDMDLSEISHNLVTNTSFGYRYNF